MNATIKQILIWVFLIAVLVFLWQVLDGGGSGRHSAKYSDIVGQANDSKIKQASIDGTEVKGTYTDGTKFQTTIPPDDSLYTALKSHGANITVRDQTSNFWVNTLISVAPFALILGLWFFLLRTMMQAKAKAAAPPQNPTL